MKQFEIQIVINANSEVEAFEELRDLVNNATNWHSLELTVNSLEVEDITEEEF